MKKFIIILVALVLLTGCGNSNKKDTKPQEEEKEQTMIYIKGNEKVLTAVLQDNSTAKKLIRKLKSSDITINMENSGGGQFNGELVFGLPTSEQNIMVKKGEIVLYKDNQLIIAYSDFFLNVTKVGKLVDADVNRIQELIKKGQTEVTISLTK